MGRILIALGSLLIIVAVATSPVTAKNSGQKDMGAQNMGAMCLRVGSVCDTGYECCSRKCWGPPPGEAVCIGSDEQPPPN